MAALFDTYLIVDWSAANQRKTGADSIWICRRDRYGERVANPPTRLEARILLTKWLGAAMVRGDRALLGFDFPFGYPAGFAAALGLSGPPWRAVWDEIAKLLHDSPNNCNNRFEVAAQFNLRISNCAFPFWGCPASKARPYLRPTHHKGHREGVLAERRFIDRREYMPGAQPCWKLFYNGCVGSQALTGIPVVRALRDDPRWSEVARVWPFETGLRVPEDARVVFAEVYPSLWKKRWEHSEERPKDKVQVRGVAGLLADLDHAGDLAVRFAGDPSMKAEERRQVETEEAWTLGVLGVTERRPRSKTPSPPARGGRGMG